MWYLLFVILGVFGKSVQSAEECGVLKNENNPPWNVGIYREVKNNNLELVCLGTAIKPNLIVTAAHCLCDQSGKVKREEFYVAPKKLDKYTKDGNRNLQKVEKADVFLHGAYKEDRKHGDIAVVKLGTSLKNDEFIPICIDWDNTTPLLKDGDKLRHPVWQNGNLKMIDVSYLDYENCPYLASSYLKKLLTSDKICARSGKDYTDDLDEGSGLIYYNFNDNLWYMRGVVCTHDPEKTNIITYSDIVLYLNWLSSISSRL